MGHNHSTATHSMMCPMEGCDHVIEVHVHDDDEAVEAIMMAGKAHFDEAHPDEKGMNESEMVEMTKKSMKKH